MSDAKRVSESPDIDANIRDQMRDYATIIGVNPSAQELIDEARHLHDAPGAVDERTVKQTFNYVLKRQTRRHQQEWKDAEQAVLGLLSEVRKHQEGEA
jgi:hypothetical protein